MTRRLAVAPEVLRQVVDHVQGGAEAPEPDEERHVHAQLHDLGLAEVLAQAGERLVRDRKVVRRHQVAERDRRSLGAAQVVRLLRPLERAYEPLGDAVVERLLVADRHAAAALVPEGDAEPDELDEAVGEQPLLAEGPAELEVLHRDLGALRVDADAERGVLSEERGDLLVRCGGDACHG